MIICEEQREENFQEYLRLLRDPNYVDVYFDEQSGGFSAVHREHKFDSEIGSYGVKIGDYEKLAVNILRRRGHSIILESELAPNGIKTPDGKIDGFVMDIKATDGMGKWSIKKKIHDAAKQGSECVILYFHKKDLFSIERVADGWNRFIADSNSQQYINTIKHILCVVEESVIEWSP